MRFKLRRAFFSLRGNFVVLDEADDTAFTAVHKLLSLGSRFSLEDASGRKVAEVRQKLLTILPKYEIDLGGRTMLLRKRFTFFKPRYVVEGDLPAPIEIEGSFFELEYSLSTAGEPVASVSKRWFSLTDTYGVEIAEGADVPLVLSAVLAISLIVHREHERG